MCSQHILKKSTYFSTCIHPFKVFAACLPSPAAAILSYSTSLSTCAKGLWHCGHYSFLSHIQWSARGRIAGEITTDGEHISKHVSECPVFFSPEGAPIPTPCFVMNPGSTTHIHRVTKCVLDFYWAATDPLDMETKEHSSAFVQMQLPSSHFANQEHKDMFHCCCLSCSKECSQQRLWIYLDSLSASHGTAR